MEDFSWVPVETAFDGEDIIADEENCGGAEYDDGNGDDRKTGNIGGRMKRTKRRTDEDFGHYRKILSCRVEETGKMRIEILRILIFFFKKEKFVKKN